MEKSFSAAELSIIMDEIHLAIDKLPDDALKETIKRKVTGEVKNKLRISDQPPLNVLTINDIFETSWPEPDLVINKLLPTGLSMLGGRPKIGKSRLTYQASFSVAAGLRFLGCKTSQGRVLILALEDPPIRIKKMIKKYDWPTDLPIDFVVLGQFDQIIGALKGEGLDRFERQIKSANYKLVIIDTYSRAIGGDQNDGLAVTDALSPLHEIAHQNSCAIMLVDHHRKRGDFSPNNVDDLLGSTAKSAVPDTIWGLIKESGKPIKLHVVGRDVRETKIKLTRDTESGFWKSEGKDDPLFMTDARFEIKEYIQHNPGSSAAEIADGVEKDRGNTHRRLTDLMAAGTLDIDDQGGKRRYRLSDNGAL